MTPVTILAHVVGCLLVMQPVEESTQGPVALIASLAGAEYLEGEPIRLSICVRNTSGVTQDAVRPALREGSITLEVTRDGVNTVGCGYRDWEETGIPPRPSPLEAGTAWNLELSLAEYCRAAIPGDYRVRVQYRRLGFGEDSEPGASEGRVETWLGFRVLAAAGQNAGARGLVVSAGSTPMISRDERDNLERLFPEALASGWLRYQRAQRVLDRSARLRAMEAVADDFQGTEYGSLAALAAARLHADAGRLSEALERLDKVERIADACGEVDSFRADVEARLTQANSPGNFTDR